MNKEKAMEYQAISTLHTLAISNGMEADKLIINACQISSRKLYRTIQFPQSYYKGYIADIEAKEDQVRQMRREGKSNATISFELDVSLNFISKARL